jgi:HEAT repeats
MKLTHTDFKRKKYARHQSMAKRREINTDLESIPDLLKLTHDSDAETRCEAIQCLCPCHVQRNRPEVWDRLFELARDSDLEVRKVVFHILGDGSPNERVNDVVSAMESMYHDPDPKLRRRARKFWAQYRRTGRVNIL